MVSPRRLVRGMLYVIAFFFFFLLALLAAYRKRLIHIGDFLPPHLVPLYFQPASDSYMVDIEIGDCNFLTKHSAKCGVPRASHGSYGDVGINGGWIRVEKDMLLGMHWTSKRYLSVKRISESYYESHRRSVVLDVAVGDPDEDCAIKGNKKCIPKSILAEMNMHHVFNDDDLLNLKDLTKSEKPNLKTDKSKLVEEHNREDKVQKARKEEEKKSFSEGKPLDEQAPDTSGDIEKKPQKAGEEGTSDKSNEEKKPPSNRQESKEGFEGEAEEETKAEMKEHSEGRNAGEATAEKETPNDTEKGKRSRIPKSHHDLKTFIRIPSEKELADSGWTKKSHNIWVKLGPASDKAVTAVDMLFGEDAVDPRPNWSLLRTPLKNLGYSTALQPKLTIRKGNKVNYKSLAFQPKIEFGAEGKFKVLQIADLHFSTGVGVCRDPAPAESAKGCRADPRTLIFLKKVLDTEKPDFVVLTGDQVFGDTAPDPETALFKSVAPLIKRKIPFAITLGNHDEAGTLSREQMMHLVSSLPFLFAAVGPDGIDGFGNYPVRVTYKGSKKVAAAFYFLDSHSRSQQPKSNPGYDWFKESQIDWLQLQAVALKAMAKDKSLLSMAFFHIPLPEYRNLEQPIVGQLREAITAPKYVTRMRDALGMAGVQVVSCGHDHANDFCLADTQHKDSDNENLMWLCYGGGAGEGGYGGYDGYIRRVRLFELDSKLKSIRTWKRAENNPEFVFDEQTVVKDNKVVTSI